MVPYPGIPRTSHWDLNVPSYEPNPVDKSLSPSSLPIFVHSSTARYGPPTIPVANCMGYGTGSANLVEEIIIKLYSSNLGDIIWSSILMSLCCLKQVLIEKSSYHTKSCYSTKGLAVFSMESKGPSLLSHL